MFITYKIVVAKGGTCPAPRPKIKKPGKVNASNQPTVKSYNCNLFISYTYREKCINVSKWLYEITYIHLYKCQNGKICDEGF